MPSGHESLNESIGVSLEIQMSTCGSVNTDRTDGSGKTDRLRNSTTYRKDRHPKQDNGFGGILRDEWFRTNATRFRGAIKLRGINRTDQNNATRFRGARKFRGVNRTDQINATRLRGATRFRGAIKLRGGMTSQIAKKDSTVS